MSWRYWEYCAIQLGKLPKGTDEVGLLNTAGKDGWELVTIRIRKIAYLKRQFASSKREITADQENCGPHPRTRVTCPDCGLVLSVKVEREGGSCKFTYGRTDWQRHCKRRNLGDPVWCLVQRDGTSETNQ